MLDNTHRGAVPIRRAFLQTEAAVAGTRAGSMTKLLRDEAALDSYLLIHALASSSEPYDTWFPSATWAQVSRLADFATLDAAKSRWAKVTTKLVDARLIARERHGNKMSYVLLHESGNGDPYTRPTSKAHGTWFGLPYLYWTEEWDRQLSMAEKVMLLISLDQPDDFRMPADRAPAWYGVSESTARRGFHGLVDHGILTCRPEELPDAKSPTGWKQVLHYTTAGDWSLVSRRAAMTRSRGVTFAPTAPAAPVPGAVPA